MSISGVQQPLNEIARDAIIETLSDHETGAGSDLQTFEPMGYDGVFYDVEGAIDVPQLAEEIVRALLDSGRVIEVMTV